MAAANLPARAGGPREAVLLVKCAGMLHLADPRPHRVTFALPGSPSDVGNQGRCGQTRQDQEETVMVKKLLRRDGMAYLLLYLLNCRCQWAYNTTLGFILGELDQTFYERSMNVINNLRGITLGGRRYLHFGWS